ncbi:MAG: hypothetical protein HKO56_06430 [Bacteroidia bacterium]|nr:hypothetical protein [Bacteroidia bacterium]NNC85424.1 hypothetical protein [Bacteroidia bacterium]NNM16276.1 hypothetical protein [Bacteroidia bacterium]
MRRVLKIFAFIFFIVSSNLFAAEVPVLLRLDKEYQNDTIGWNFVEQLTKVVYNEVVHGRAKLWDSHAKSIQISGVTLKTLEKNTGSKFVDQKFVWVYEYWNKSKKGLSSKCDGFFFYNKDANGKKVSYGYVDYDDVEEVFLRTKIQGNSNARYSTTFAYAIQRKLYNYDIIQYKDRVVNNLVESEKLKLEFVKGKKFNVGNENINIPDKLVTYIVRGESSLNDNNAKNSRLLLTTIQDYLNENKEVFFNLGGDRILSHFQVRDLKVTQVEMTELWTKNGSDIRHQPRSMKIFVNDSALNLMPVSDIEKLELILNDQTLTGFLKSKKYNFYITMINYQAIPRRDSYTFFKALNTYNWNKITEYVKYY